MTSALLTGADFDGVAYQDEFDFTRLTGQIQRVYECMRDGRWRTLSEIAAITAAPESSESAQLRNLRKPKFGRMTIEKRARGERSHGRFEYRLTGAAEARP